MKRELTLEERARCTGRAEAMAVMNQEIQNYAVAMEKAREFMNSILGDLQTKKLLDDCSDAFRQGLDAVFERSCQKLSLSIQKSVSTDSAIGAAIVIDANRFKDTLHEFEYHEVKL